MHQGNITPRLHTFNVYGSTRPTYFVSSTTPTPLALDSSGTLSLSSPLLPFLQKRELSFGAKRDECESAPYFLANARRGEGRVEGSRLTRLPDALPFLGLRQGGGRGGAIQGKEGIKFCSVA